MDHNRSFDCIILRLFINLICILLLGACGQSTPVNPTKIETSASVVPPITNEPTALKTKLSPTINLRIPSATPFLSKTPRTVPAATITPVPTNTRMVTPTATPLIPDRKEITSVLRWIVWGCVNQKADVIGHFINPGEEITISKSFSGGEKIASSVFLDDLQLRYKSYPLCAGYSISKDQVVLWTNGWKPNWRQTQDCSPKCSPLQKAFESSKAAFVFRRTMGEWNFNGLVLQDYAWYTTYIGSSSTSPLIACGQAFSGLEVSFQPTPGLTSAFCPGILPPRLVKGELAYVNPIPPVANRVRKDPGKESTSVGSIQAGKSIKVLDGPVCLNHQAWWKVEEIDTNLTGWTAEGDDQGYWITPCDSPTGCKVN